MSTVRLVLLLLSVLAAALLAAWFIGGDAETPPGGVTPSAAAAPPPPTVLVVFPSTHNRFIHAPCNMIPGDGLASFSTVLNVSKSQDHVLGVAMGDICSLPGPLGGSATRLLVTEFLPSVGVRVLAAGPGELQYGVGFVRQQLRRAAGLDVLCGNATDSEGQSILKAWSVASTTDADGRPGRTFLFVGVAGLSIRDELTAAGSDVELADPIPVVKSALADGLERAREREVTPHVHVLLVHGTANEAVQILQAVPGFDVAAVADGPKFPPLRPRMAGSVPVLYPGAEGRFVNWCNVAGASPPTLTPGLSRLGRDILTRGDRSREQLFRAIASLAATARAHTIMGGDTRPQHAAGDYAGGDACATCHAEVEARHAKSPHAAPTARWAVGGSDGSPQCVVCHTTAPAWSTGYRGPGDTSRLRTVDCEACHGPGADHVAEPGPGYGAVSWGTCTKCHTPERSPGFNAAARWGDVRHGPR